MECVRKWFPCLEIAYNHFLLELSYVLLAFFYLLRISCHLGEVEVKLLPVL